MQSRNPIYLDYNATTPTDSRVVEAMLPYFTDFFGNAASATHSWGWKAQNALTKSREKIANFLHAAPSEIYFTSGSSEANNWTIFGVFQQFYKTPSAEPIHFITSQVEHPSILEAMKELEQRGAEVTYLKVNSYGQVEAETLKAAIKPHTKLISLIWVNNEIGTINDIANLGKIARDRKIYFHTDATQALGKVPIDLSSLPVDLLSFSAHKIYGPKGIGALFVRSRSPHVTLTPLIFGGGQERGQRAGTANIPGAVGFAKACEILLEEGEIEIQRTQKLRDLLWQELQKEIPGLKLNGHPTERSPTNLNFSNSTSTIDLLLPKLQKLGFSTGAACGSGDMKGSHVLKALGLSTQEIESSLRISIGRPTQEEDIYQTVAILKAALG